MSGGRAAFSTPSTLEVRRCPDRKSRRGDTVKLRSGGPVMTVGKMDGTGGWHCYWFVGGAASPEFRSAQIPAEALEPAKPAASSAGAP